MSSDNAASRVLSGAMALFGSPGSDLKSLLPLPGTGTAATSKITSTNPDDIPKEELLHLCMKMNKRMQGMEYKGQELIRKQKSLLAERKELIQIIKGSLKLNGTADNSIHTSTNEDDEIDVVMLKGLFESAEMRKEEKYKQIEETLFISQTSHKAELFVLETKYKKLISELQLSSGSTVANADTLNVNTITLDKETLV